MIILKIDVFGNMDTLYQQLKNYGRVKLNEPMKKHTTFKIGGLARYFVVVEETKKLIGLLNFLIGEGINYFILGGGSNLLFSDDEYDGIVIQIKNSGLQIMDNTIIAEAGVLLGQVVDLAAKNSLTGMEWGVGIPGTIGGAARGNAGAYGSDTSAVLDKVEVWQNGEIIELKNNDCQFAYRDSILKKNNGLVVLRVYLKLNKGDKIEIMKKMIEYAKQRSCRITSYPTCGCFFKNVKLDNYTGDKNVLDPKFIERGKIPAGWLIEQAGCAQLNIGVVKVSDLHNNIIENCDQATQADVLKIVEQIKDKVYNKFGVNLEPEVEIV